MHYLSLHWEEACMIMYSPRRATMLGCLPDIKMEIFENTKTQYGTQASQNKLGDRGNHYTQNCTFGFSLWNLTQAGHPDFSVSKKAALKRLWKKNDDYIEDKTKCIICKMSLINCQNSLIHFRYLFEDPFTSMCCNTVTHITCTDIYFQFHPNALWQHVMC